MQNLSEEAAAAAGVPHRILIPQVRYHPSIQTQTPRAGATAPKTRAGNKKTGLGVGCPPSSGWQSGDNTAWVDPISSVRPCVNEGHKQKPSLQKPAKKPNLKKDQQSAKDPDPAHTLVQLCQKDPPRPEHIPPGLGVHLDRCLVEEVELLTRGQRTNKAWFNWRKNRITASVAHRIAHCRYVNSQCRTPPPSYLAAITGEGPRVQTRAMNWGIEMESEVVRRYQRLKSLALGRSILVQDCGLFIDAQHPWLAASPDGIVTDSRTGQRLLCLEVKCPYKHRNRRVEDACRDDPAFCLQILRDQDEPQSKGPPVYGLKASHSYFTQIQCQLAVTGLHCADLVVFTLKETAIVPVNFDPKMWKETVSKLEVFYRDAVLPKLRDTGRECAAAWTPEQ